MKNLLNFLVLLITFTVGSMSIITAQVTNTSFYLNYNTEANTIDLNLIINEGETKSVINRIQASSQITFVVPTGVSITTEQFYMPLKGNQNYKGTVPTVWNRTSMVTSPTCQSQNDFISFTPNISPPSFFNDIKAGDTIKIFSLAVSGGDATSIRLYENGVDPSSIEPGMQGGDFSQVYTIGSPTNIYENNVYNYDFSDPELTLETSEEMSICIGQSIELSANMDGNWYSDDNNIAMIENVNLIHGLVEGQVSFAFHSEKGHFAKTPRYNILKSDDISCLTGSIHFTNNEINLYPNPVDNHVIIEGEADIEDISVYSISGEKQSIYGVKYDNKLNVDTSSLKEGMYMLNIGKSRTTQFTIIR